jgi:hypothetical protein
MQTATTSTALTALNIYGTGQVNIPTNISSTSTVTGSLTIGGGVGVSGQVTAGTNLVVGVNYNSGGYTALQISLSAVSGGYTLIQSVSSAGTSYGNIVFNTSGGAVGIGTTPPSNPGTTGALYCLSLFVNGSSKSFVIDHPIKKDKYLVHACLEGPTTDVFYRGESQLKNGTVNIELPKYFEKLTEEKNRTILLTNIEGFDKLAVKRGGVKNGTFTVYSDNPKSEQEFYWEVKAQRKDTTFGVEPYKDEVKVYGFGPYKYVG